jgi:hypothetical protein
LNIIEKIDLFIFLTSECQIIKFLISLNYPASPLSSEGGFINPTISRIGDRLTDRAPRHLELLRLTQSLQRYALALQSDVNAAFLLVHNTLSRALTQRSGDLAARPSEASLRRDIDRAYAAAPKGCHACA